MSATHAIIAAVTPVATVTNNVVTLNAATSEARATQSPMALPVAVITDPVKAVIPGFAYHERLSTAVTSFVKAMAANGRKQDALILSAAALADKLVTAIHADGKPGYAAYMSAQNEVKAASVLQYLQPMTLIKAYRAALTRAYGDLPVSESAAAQAKAKARAKKAQDKANKGAVKGVPEVKPIAEHEVIGQFIAKFGTAAVLVELAKILATEKSTVNDAHTLMDVAKHFAK